MIHKLAQKGKSSGGGKAACHSDEVADAEEAKRIQREALVQLDVRPALGIAKEPSVL